MDNGDGTHTYLAPVEYRKYCIDCGAVLDTEYNTDERAVRGHEGSGVCDECGAVIDSTACTHPNMQTVTQTKFSKDNVQYVDENTHSFTLGEYQMTYEYCEDCGYRSFVDESFISSVEGTEAHQTDSDGWCSVCGCNVKDGKACDHVGYVYENRFTYCNYLTGEADEWGHCAVCADCVERYCDRCGEWLDEEEGPEYLGYMQHEFDDQGICRVCGYKSSCTHPNLIKDEWSEPDLSTYVDEKTHNTLYVDIENFYCPDCGWTSVKTVGSEWSSGESHCIMNGSCTECGYVPECTHPKAVVDPECSVEDVWADYIDLQTHNEYLFTQKAGFCPDCGALIIFESITKQLGVKPHVYDEDGICKCGAVDPGDCEHPEDYVTEVEVPDTRETRYIPVNGNDNVHSVEVYALYQKYCGNCGAIISVTSEPEPVRTLMPRTVAHTFENGVCKYCGFVQSCDHPNAVITTGEPKFERYDKTATEHTMVSKVVKTITCPDCGYEGSETTYVNGDAEAHTFENGVCTVCKYECLHPEDQRAFGELVVKAETVAEDDSAHVTVTTTTTPYACKLCGEEGEKVETVQGAPEKHTYEKTGDGAYVCEKCDHECGHSNAADETATEFDHYEQTAAEHTPVSVVTVTTTCPDCGDVTVETSEVAGEAEAHEWEEGVCTVCEYVCQHETTSDETIHEVLDYEEIDDEFHYELGNEFVETTCDVCGVVTNTTDPVDWKSEPVEHSYADGVCAECGHECSHEGHEVGEDVFVAKSCASISATEHAVTGDVHHVISCDLCGAQLSDEVVQENVVVNGKHVFSGRKCTLCGYTKPVETNETPSVVDEQIFNEVSADEKVHGVAVSEHLRMAVALVRALRGITEEYGEDVQIRIIDIELILTDAEIEALNALIPEERILVFLNVLGYVNEVNIANEELEIKLSDEAQALLDGIAARLEAMTEEERAEFDATVQTVYPVLQVEVDGTVADQTEIVIELKLREKNAYRVERYTFRCEDGSWYFAALAN